MWGVFLLIISLSCGAPKALLSLKNDAETATSQENYVQAVELWKQYFNQQGFEDCEGLIIAQAAKTAYKSGDLDLALNWFDQARYKSYADAEMYATLAKIFKEKKNISKELDALEFIEKNYSENLKEIDKRLFEVYFEINLPEKAVNVWERLDAESKNELVNLSHYLSLQIDLENSAVCDSVSLVLLEMEPQHQEALEWQAKKYYWLGENRYRSEMAKYEKKKTNKQYKILLKELDKATADFKKSLTYFNKLWKLESGEKYASYFANIYARFGDEKKSKFYQKYMK